MFWNFSIHNFSKLCQDVSVDENQPILPADVTHYVIPSMDTLLSFLDILQLDQFRGIIFAQSVVQRITYDHGGLYL